MSVVKLSEKGREWHTELFFNEESKKKKKSERTLKNGEIR
jgi:hypothetical protein